MDNQARIVLVYLDRTSGNPGLLINSGSAVAANITGTHDLLQYLPDLPNDDYEPLSMVRLVSGTEAIGWENLYDVRQFFVVQSTGTGGGDTILTANRIVVTNDAGQQTTNQYFQYDYDNNVLVLGAGISDVHTLGTNSFHFMGSGTSPSWNLWAFGTGIAGFNTFFRARGVVQSPRARKNVLNPAMPSPNAQYAQLGDVPLPIV